MAKEQTVTQRVIARHQTQDTTALESLSTKLVGLVFMGIGTGIFLAHQWAVKWQHGPEWKILVPSMFFVILGAAAFMPKVLSFAIAIVREVVGWLPFTRKSNGVSPTPPDKEKLP